MSNHTTRHRGLAKLTHNMNPQEGVKVTVKDADERTVSGSVQSGSHKANGRSSGKHRTKRLRLSRRNRRTAEKVSLEDETKARGEAAQPGGLRDSKRGLNVEVQWAVCPWACAGQMQVGPSVEGLQSTLSGSSRDLKLRAR